ncbi:MAG: helix-hairpin-helix domain-containing protein [Pirellulaceae bacterium]
MPASRQPERPPWPRLTLRRTDQAAAAVVLLAALLLLAGHWWWQGRLRGRLIEIDRAAPIAIEFKIDINAADWPELALLPGIGEQLSKRIVADRQANGRFPDLDALRRVRGIGPNTLNGMRPYLLPMADVEATAGGSEPRGDALGNAIN